MKKTMKQLCTWLLAVLLLCTVSTSALEMPVVNTDAAPYYVVIRSISGDLEINRSGKATCRASVRTPSSDYSITLDCSLCESDGSVVKSWSTTGKGTVSLDKSWYVTSGSRYQVVATATVYDANGNYVDSGTAYSSVVSY